MRICVTSQGDDLESEVDPRFGRCVYFMMVDTETMEFEPVLNGGVGARGGAGVQAAQAVGGLGAEALVTGHVGPNAFDALRAAGIRIFTGASGTVREALKEFKSGSLDEATGGPTTESHSGMRMRGK